MKHRSTNPADGLFGTSSAEWRLLDERTYEGRIVDFLFSRYNLPRAIKYQMEEDCGKREGIKRLTLQDFQEQFPSFPLVLRSRYISKLPARVPISGLFNDFLALPFAKEFEKVREELDPDAGQPVLVLGWPRLQGQVVQEKTTKQTRLREEGGSIGLAVYRAHAEQRISGTRIVYRGISGDELTVEPFSQLLRRVDRAATGSRTRKWSPE